MEEKRLNDITEALHQRAFPTPGPDGKIQPAPVSQETAIVIDELKRELKRLHSPYLSPRDAAVYLSVDVATINQLKNKGLLKAQYVEGMNHPRYLRSDLDALMKTRK